LLMRPLLNGGTLAWRVMAESVAAQFSVTGILKLRSRRGIFVCGEVLSGIVTAGVKLEWPIHRGNTGTALLVREVEYVDYGPGVACVALVVQFDEDAVQKEQSLRESLEVGMVVRVCDLTSTLRGPSA